MWGDETFQNSLGPGSHVEDVVVSIRLTGNCLRSPCIWCSRVPSPLLLPGTWNSCIRGGKTSVQKRPHSLTHSLGSRWKHVLTQLPKAPDPQTPAAHNVHRSKRGSMTWFLVRSTLAVPSAHCKKSCTCREGTLGAHVNSGHYSGQTYGRIFLSCLALIGLCDLMSVILFQVSVS